MNEAFKKQLLNNYEIFKPKRWEGKPFSFKLKFLYANYPEIAFAYFMFLIIGPAVVSYKTYTYDSSRRAALSKYRAKYTVVRDDHPNLEEIIKEKEFGRDFFPKY